MSCLCPRLQFWPSSATAVAFMILESTDDHPR
jgi:hypothetical protein